MTVKTIKPSGGDYSTLSAWLAARPGGGTLVTVEQADIDNFGSGGLVESAGVSFAGYITTSTNKFIINVPSGQRHTGVAHSGAYITNGAGSVFATLRLGTDYIDVDWLEVEGLNNQPPIYGFGSVGPTVTNNRLLINHSLIHGSGTIYGAVNWSNWNQIFRNTISYTTGASRMLDVRGNASLEVSNSLFYTQGGDFPYLTDPAHVTKNTYIGGASNQCFWSSGSNTGNNNASSDATATAQFSSSINSIAGSAAFTNVTAGSEDFRTKSGFTGLSNLGATLAAITDDIVGTARPQGASYDIGPFENISGGGGGTVRRSMALTGVG